MLTGSDRSEAFLEAHPTLVLDTKHFDADFVDRLLTSFDRFGRNNGRTCWCMAITGKQSQS